MKTLHWCVFYRNFSNMKNAMQLSKIVNQCPVFKEVILAMQLYQISQPSYEIKVIKLCKCNQLMKRIRSFFKECQIVSKFKSYDGVRCKDLGVKNHHDMSDWTLLICLNTVQNGGATYFSQLNIDQRKDLHCLCDLCNAHGERTIQKGKL
jgi:hypothetical protein